MLTKSTTSYRCKKVSLSTTSSSTSSMSDICPTIQLLQASVDPDQRSEFRILVGGTSIRYLIIDPGVYEVSDMCFEPSLISMLPPIPPGDWNQGYISYNTATGQPHFADVKKDDLPQVTSHWHPVQIDYLELQMGKKIRSNVYEATCSRFSSIVIAKFARFTWEVPQLDAETAAYERIENHDIGPKFLGHLTEEGRVIGFVMQYIPEYHHATSEDLHECQATLLKLHKLGIKHGDTNKHNFLVHSGKAIIIDFDQAISSASEMSLEEEFKGLENQLNDTSVRGWQRTLT